MSKYYFQKSDYGGYCYQLKHWKEKREISETDIILEEAERETGSGFFYCNECGECGEVGEGCGKECKAYEPRNGKNGRCKHSQNTYTGNGKFFRLTKENKLIRIDEIQNEK